MTTVAMLLAPWVLAVAVSAPLQRLERAFTPAWSVRLAAGMALLFAVATAMSSAAVIALVVGDPTPVGIGLAVLAGAFLAAGCVRATRHVLRAAASLRAGKVFRGSAARRGDLLVVDDATPDAFAVPGRGAVVVVTTGLCAALDRAEFAALVRHERAHLRARHYLYVQAAELAAGLNPLLAGWPRLVRFAAERDADERAAGDDRAVLARALARAALICAGSRPPEAAALGAAAGDVVRRVTALQGPRPGQPRRWAVLACAAVVAVTVADVGVTTDLVQDRVVPEKGESSVVVIG